MTNFIKAQYFIEGGLFSRIRLVGSILEEITQYLKSLSDRIDKITASVRDWLYIFNSSAA